MSFCAAANLPDGGFGESGAGSGLIVTFDTYENGSDDAPSVRIVAAGTELWRLRKVDFLRTAGEFVPVTVEMRPGGSLSLTYRGETLLGGLTNGLLTRLPAGTRWGLGARTGASFDRHLVDDLEIVADHLPGPAGIRRQPTNAWATYGSPRATVGDRRRLRHRSRTSGTGTITE